MVGLGWWGRIIVPLLKTSQKLRVVKGVDPTPAGAEFAAAQQIAYASFEEALKDPAVQGVVLCTPHTLHADQIVAAANAKKHVFCEKPLSLNRADVLRAVAACNQNEVALAVGHEKRFEPPIQELARMAKAGELGTLLQIEANFSQDKFLSLAVGQLAHVREGGAGRADDRHRHPPARPLGRPARPGAAGLRARAPARQPAGERRHAGDPGFIQESEPTR